jgi:hypothetical protein
MKSFFAALRSLVLPYGATSGSRIVLDGVNGKITVYNSAGTAIGIIDGTFGIQVNGVNNGYVQTNVGIDPDTGLSQAQITFRASSTTWLPDADIDTGVIRVFGESGSGLLPQGRISTEIDAAAWKFGSGAANLVPPVIKMSTATYSSGVNPTVEIRDENSTNNFDFRVTGRTSINGASLTINAPFGRENVTLDLNPTVLVSGATGGLSGSAPLTNNNNFGMWVAGTPGTVTITRKGVYKVGGNVRFPAQAVTAGFRQLYFLVNGGLIADFILPTTTAMNGFATTVFGEQRFAASVGDTVTFAALHTAGVNLTVQATSRVWVELVESTL